MHPEFLQSIRDSRELWRSQHPDMPILVGDEIVKDEPERFRRDVPEVTVKQRTEIQDDGTEVIYGSHKTREFFQIAWNLSKQWFPTADFYRIHVSGKEPVQEFMYACLQTDPRRLIGDCGNFFTLQAYSPRLVTDGFELVEGEADDGWGEPAHDLAWSIPVYPDMTARDLTDAMPAIMELIRRKLGPVTTSARIGALRVDGLTHRDIAERLGLDINTVRKHFR